MIAFLGMYDLPQLQPANDRFWTAIRSALDQGPTRLTRDVDPWEVWQHPDLLLAQTCGMPYRTRLHGKVRLVGTPDYRLPGCPEGHYCSVLISRPGMSLSAAAGGRFAYNEALSQSGWAAPISHLRKHDLHPSALVASGAHMASAQMVADGQADLAGIDALTWALLETHHPDLTAALMVLDRTSPTPALPFITSPSRDPAALAAALAQAIRHLSPADREVLHLQGLTQIPAESYLAVPTPPGPAAWESNTGIATPKTA